MNTIAFACSNKDEAARAGSSSGGVFVAVAKEVIAEGGVVFGAAFDGNWEVSHVACSTEETLPTLMQSKYVQSSMGRAHGQVEQHLLAHRKVLFCGTPCQVHGLLAYLKCKGISGALQGNLLTMDFICHGVPSRKIWRDYLAELSKGHLIVSVSFRDKTAGWKNFGLKIVFADGTEFFQPWRENPYLRGFIKNLFLRPSCHRCRFKGMERPTDFTLGDFWGVEQAHPGVFDNGGTSVLLVHTPTGMRVWDSVRPQFTVCETSATLVCQFNAAAMQSVPKHPRRNAFFNNYTTTDVAARISSFAKIPMLARIRRKIQSAFRHWGSAGK